MRVVGFRGSSLCVDVSIGVRCRVREHSREAQRLMLSLRTYQNEGTEWLIKRKTALLADEPGLGKSCQFVRACDALGARRVLVVCPASVVINWQREFEKFSWTGVEPTVVSYNKINSLPDDARYEVLGLDEAHYLKSQGSQRTQNVYGEDCKTIGGLIERCDRVYAITGTPMPNNPSELWTHLRALAPDTIPNPKTGKPQAFWTFTQKFCNVVNNGFGTAIKGGRRLDILREMIDPFMLRRLKKDVLKDLPGLEIGQIFVQGRLQLDDDEKKILRKLVKAKGEKIDILTALKALGPHSASLRRKTGEAKVKGVIDWVEGHMEGCDKLVVFAQHTSVINELWKAWHGKYGAVYLDGSVPGAKRQAAVDAFQNNPDCRIFIGQLIAAGAGITLTAASDLLLVESSWVPTENEQPIMRIHRFGQKNACIAYFATLAGSIDEDIQKAAARKAADIQKVFG